MGGRLIIWLSNFGLQIGHKIYNQINESIPIMCFDRRTQNKTLQFCREKIENESNCVDSAHNEDALEHENWIWVSRNMG